MAGKINLDPLNVDELEQLIKDAQKAIEQRKTDSAKTTLEEVKALAASRGFDLDELLQMGVKKSGTAGTKKVLGKAPVKYRDPANPQNEWSGRGKLPGWMVKAMNTGKTKEDFRIKA